jgi:hypothetical protein
MGRNKRRPTPFIRWCADLPTSIKGGAEANIPGRRVTAALAVNKQ